MCLFDQNFLDIPSVHPVRARIDANLELHVAHGLLGVSRGPKFLVASLDTRNLLEALAECRLLHGHLSISQPWEIDACSPSVSSLS